MAAFTARAGAPVNILYLPGVPSLGELAASGVRRISLGTGWYRHALGAAERSARAVIGEGKLERIWETLRDGVPNDLRYLGRNRRQRFSPSPMTNQ